MRRKLIKQDAFEQIANGSLIVAENELIQAERILSRALGQDLKFYTFNENSVLYATEDDTFVHASYDLEGGKLNLNNIEELVVDEASKNARRHTVLGEMLDNIVRDKPEKADSLFKDYMSLTSFNEAVKFAIKSKEEDGETKVSAEEREDDDSKEKKLPKKKSPFEKMKSKKSKDENDKDKKGAKGFPFAKKKDAIKDRLKAAGKKIEEAYTVACNVLDYVEVSSVGPVLSESVCNTDNSGNVVDIQIPTTKLRNEAKILSFDWKVLDHKLKVLRSGAKHMCEDHNFVRSIANLKTQNKISDMRGLEESLDEIATRWPNVIYLTQDELAAVVAEALEMAGERNFDDQTCSFMAEGILRRVHESYGEKVRQILQVSSAPKCENKDAYEFFKGVAEAFYPVLDQRHGLEMKVFEDLYESLEEIYRMAERRNDGALKHETAGYLNELADTLNEKTRPDLDLAEEVAHWLTRFIEANVTGASETWSVNNKPHHTINGEHPQMAKNARVPGHAAGHEGEYGDPAPMIGQDDMNYRGGRHSGEARNRSWGNIGGNDTWPSLSNPYVPKPFGDYTMKGEKGVDKDHLGQYHSTWQSKDTWPNLQNPYVPHEVGATGGQGYKMKNGSDTDLIVDKGVNTR